MKIRFTLRNEDEQQDKRTEKYPIVLVVEDGKVRRKLSTGEKVHAENWDKGIVRYVDQKKLRAAHKNVKTSLFITKTEADELNGRLNQIYADVSEIAKDGKLTVDEVIIKYKGKDPESSPAHSVEAVLQRYIDEHISESAKGSLNVYRTVKTDLISFRAKGNEVSFAVIGEVDFFKAFRKYLLEDLKLVNSTIAKRISVLRVLIAYAKDDQKISGIGDSYLRLKNHEKTPGDPIALTKEELDILYKMDLRDKPSQEIVRDAFVFAAVTSFRRSDLHQLHNYHIGKDSITLTIEKTERTQTAPLTPYSRAIIKKYNGKPPLISDQASNEIIKQIAKDAGFNRMVELIERRGNKRTSHFKPLHEVITNHTSRKSFASILLTLGVPREMVKAAGGWRSSAFDRYVDIEKKQIQSEIERAWKSK
jgi:integrase